MSAVAPSFCRPSLRTAGGGRIVDFEPQQGIDGYDIKIDGKLVAELRVARQPDSNKRVWECTDLEGGQHGQLERLKDWAEYWVGRAKGAP